MTDILLQDECSEGEEIIDEIHTTDVYDKCQRIMDSLLQREV